MSRWLDWRPRTAPLPEDLAALVRPEAPELDAPAFADPTHPATAVAAFPGGVVPEDIP